MSRPKKKRTSRPRCRDCGAPIVFFRSWTGNWRTFDPKPVNGRTHVGALAYPILYGRAWRLQELVDELMARHQYSSAEAEDEAYDVPWRVAHTCRETPTTTSEREHDQ